MGHGTIYSNTNWGSMNEPNGFGNVYPQTHNENASK
jgi:hypothetical protein